MKQPCWRFAAALPNSRAMVPRLGHDDGRTAPRFCAWLARLKSLESRGAAEAVIPPLRRSALA
jgi:hypothetical protein